MRLDFLRKLIPLALLLSVTLACGLAQRIKQASDNSKGPTVLTSADGKFQLTIPGDWRSDPELHESADPRASNRLEELYVVVLSESKEDFVDDMTLEKFVTMTRDNMKTTLTSLEITEPRQLSINGYPAIQYEMFGVADNMKVAYINTTIDTPEHYHQVLAWTLRSRYDKNQSALRAVVQSFREVAGAGTPQRTAPPPPPAPTQPKAESQKH